MRRYKYICYPSIGIVKEDFDELPKILASLGEWVSKTRKRAKNRKIIVEAICFDSVLGEFLKENDYIEKSLKSPRKILEKIPEDLVRYFLLGLVDADGCFYVNEKNRAFQFCLSGSFKQDWSSIEEIFTKIGVKYSIYRRSDVTSGCSAIRVTNIGDISKIGRFIYSGHLMGLKRKREKFNAIKYKYFQT